MLRCAFFALLLTLCTLCGAADQPTAPAETSNYDRAACDLPDLRAMIDCVPPLRCPTDSEIIAGRGCAPIQLSQAEESMLAAYRDALLLSRKWNHALPRKLIAAQRAWLEYRKRQCDFAEGMTLTNDHLDHAGCMLELTTQRTKALKLAAQGLNR